MYITFYGPEDFIVRLGTKSNLSFHGKSLFSYDSYFSKTSILTLHFSKNIAWNHKVYRAELSPSIAVNAKG